MANTNCSQTKPRSNDTSCEVLHVRRPGARGRDTAGKHGDDDSGRGEAARTSGEFERGSTAEFATTGDAAHGEGVLWLSGHGISSVGSNLPRGSETRGARGLRKHRTVAGGVTNLCRVGFGGLASVLLSRERRGAALDRRMTNIGWSKSDSYLLV